jgi:probable F420-dependent oxidoreductase
MRLGLSLPLAPLDAPACCDLAADMAPLGYRDVWIAEVGGHDAYALAAAVAARVPGLRIGAAVTPAQTRSPMVHAMAAATLSQLTEGNFVVGIGISSENIVRDWAGLPFDRPLTRMLEHVEVLRAALGGEKVDYRGETVSMQRFRLQTRPVGTVPIYMGALNAGMLRLAGRIADGVCVNMVPEDALPQVLAEVRTGAEEAGRDPNDIEVVARLHCILSDDPATDREIVRQGFGAYAATSVYNRFFRWIGYEAEAVAIAEAFARGDRDAVAAAMTDGLCDAIALVGDRGELRARIRAYAEAGVDVCALNPLWPDPGAQRRLLEACAGSLDDLDGPADLGVRGVVRATGA